MTWIRFLDLYRGGTKKLGWDYLYIQGSLAEAVEYFRTQFGRDPKRTGDEWYHFDYGIHVYPTLTDAVEANLSPGESHSGHLSRADVLVVERPESSSINENTRRNRRPDKRHRDGVRPRR